MTSGIFLIPKKMKRVAIQGIAGCYHEVAARNYFKEEEIAIEPCPTFAHIFKAMSKDDTLLGVMAIENTIAGSLLQNHELLRKSDVCIVGEYKLRISHSLAALPDETMEDITEINSHPIALMQCEEFLDEFPKIKIVEKGDTALSARESAEKQLKGHAAICSKFAAQLYGLKTLAEGIETALSVIVATGLPSWSCINAGGLERVTIPNHVKRVLIFADKDRTGTGERAASMLAQRLEALGVAVRVVAIQDEIPDGVDGIDFNDLLCRGGKDRIVSMLP